MKILMVILEISNSQSHSILSYFRYGKKSYEIIPKKNWESRDALYLGFLTGDQEESWNRTDLAT